MRRTLNRGEDGVLSDVLAGILGRLRGQRYERVSVPFAAEGIAEGLAGHLRHAEETCFPAIRKGEAGSAGVLDQLEQDHRLLGLYAQDLATRIQGDDREGAYEVARSFLAVLLD